MASLSGVWPAFTATDALSWNYLPLIALELLVGFMIGFCAAIPFWFIDSMGFLIDNMRGASIATVLNPTLSKHSSLLGVIFTQMFSLLFLLTHGFNELIAAIYHSYVALPPGTALRFDHGFLDFLGNEWHLLYELCLRFSMPAVVVMLLTDLALGLINRSAQQLNVFFLSMPIKSVLSLFVLIISLPVGVQMFFGRSAHFSERISTLMGLLH